MQSRFVGEGNGYQEYTHRCMFLSILSWTSIDEAEKDGTRSNLLIMLDHPDPELIVLEYTISNNGNRDVAGLKTVNHLSLYERSARAAEFCNTVILDPSGTVAVASCYKGKLKVLLLEEGTVQRDFDVS